MANKRLTFIELVKKLRKAFPADRPIKVRRCLLPYDNGATPKERLYGDCTKRTDCYIIRINKTDKDAIQKDTLLHEWAHCICKWEIKPPYHNDSWGIAYARIYREIVDNT